PSWASLALFRSGLAQGAAPLRHFQRRLIKPLQILSGESVESRGDVRNRRDCPVDPADTFREWAAPRKVSVGSPPCREKVHCSENPFRPRSRRQHIRSEPLTQRSGVRLELKRSGQPDVLSQVMPKLPSGFVQERGGGGPRTGSHETSLRRILPAHTNI